MDSGRLQMAIEKENPGAEYDHENHEQNSGLKRFARQVSNKCLGVRLGTQGIRMCCDFTHADTVKRILLKG